jgi:hypothetical protein
VYASSLSSPAHSSRRYSAGPRLRARGFSGALPAQDQMISAVAQAGAATSIATLVAMGSIGGPVGAAIGGLISLAGVIANMFGGCGQTCVAASNIANQLDGPLGQAFNTYMASPVHYQSMQTAYLQLFDSTWAALSQACSNPQLGSAGQACINDRARDGCTWKVSPGGWSQNGDGSWTYTPYGPNGSGSTCWNWFVGMRDPVANDPTVVPDPPPGAAMSSALNLPTWVLPAAIGFLIVFLL